MARKVENSRKTLVKAELVTMAAELFASQGVSRTTFNDIGQALGLSRSSLYHYFKNKDEILDELIAEQTLLPVLAMKELISDPSLRPAERLRRAIILSVERKLAGGARFRVLDKIEFELPPKLADRHHRNKREVLHLWTSIISEGVRSGEFRQVDVRVAAFAVIGMANWTAWWYSPDGSKVPDEIAVEIADFGVRMLLSASSLAPGGNLLQDLRSGLAEMVATIDRASRP